MYREFRRALGWYDFWYAIDLSGGGEVFVGDPHAFRRVVDLVLGGGDVRFRCGFAFDMCRGGDCGWVEYGVKERVFDWDSGLRRFVLVGEAVYSDCRVYSRWGEV